MTATITVTGWLNEIKEFDWGRVFTVSESIRAKNPDGEWETIGRNYWDVTIPTDVMTGNLAKDDQIVVTGYFSKGKPFTRKDGTLDIGLKVRATHVSRYEREEQATAPAPTRPNVPSGWTAVDDAPF
jgi:hypothetical protein